MKTNDTEAQRTENARLCAENNKPPSTDIRIAEALERIANCLEAWRMEFRPKKKAPRKDPASALRAMASEMNLDPTPVNRVLELWAHVCPGNPRPIIDDLRRAKLRGFIDRFARHADGPYAAIEEIFRVVAENDWLSGREYAPGKRRHAAVGLFEVINNLSAIVEGTYK